MNCKLVGVFVGGKECVVFEEWVMALFEERIEI